MDGPKAAKRKPSSSGEVNAPSPKQRTSTTNKDNKTESASPPVLRPGYSFERSTLTHSRDPLDGSEPGDFDIGMMAPPQKYHCMVRVVGAEGLRRNDKLFSCYVNLRIPGGAMATSSIAKKEEKPFWDQSALMELSKKPNYLYVELMAHEAKVFGAAKDVLVSKVRVPLRKFIRGKDTDLRVEFPEVKGSVLLQVCVRGFGRSWVEGRMSGHTVEMEDRSGSVTLFRIIKTATSMSVAKTEFSSTMWEIA